MADQRISDLGAARAIHDGVAFAIKSSNYADLAGYSAKARLRLARMRIGAAYREAMARLDEVMAHEHDWNGDDYCNICGQDGRA